MATRDQIARLRLIRSEQIGPVTYGQLIARFGSAEAAIDIIPDLAARGGGRPPRIATVAEAEQEVARVEKLGARHLFLGEDNYPPLLAHIEAAPPVLTCMGNTQLLARPMVSMVGARNASASACRFARQLAQQLGDRGSVIVSGLARGVDSAAHDGALSTGTIAVIAGGIDIFYPPENEERQRAIGGQGLILAEQPPGTEPRARHFPYRNRIIAGLAPGTIVVEAAPKSGSLITARYAAEFGREVMAVPGSPLDPRAQGCNQLIREGATLVQNADDVLEALGPIGAGLVRQDGSGFQAPPGFGDADEAARGAVVDLLNVTPVAIDELIRQSNLSAPIVQTVLLELELAGRIERHAGGRVSLA
ncbi:MAG TPA: DNA-processing protein DprA [Allosphingosinicella sp.]|nr:DNA-processing protein DprA [Allosphingosinicella sp.]